MNDSIVNRVAEMIKEDVEHGWVPEATAARLEVLGLLVKSDVRIANLLECDHIRIVAWHDGQWRHLNTQDGTLAGVCTAGVYRVRASVDNRQHTLVNLVDSEVSKEGV